MSHLRARRRIDQLRDAVALLRHPSWLLVHVAARRRRWLNAGDFDLSRYFESLSDAETAVDRLFGTNVSQAARAKLSDGRPDYAGLSDYALAHGAPSELLQVLDQCVRRLRPAVVVETGVASGLSSECILNALNDNAHGHLYSVDLPALGHRREVGDAVSAQLRARWTLVLGPAEFRLRTVLPEIAPVDIFLHDSDHSRLAQLAEYRLAWRYLRTGGLLISDDVGNDAFVTFAAEVDAAPVLVPRLRSQGRTAVGMIRKAVP